MDLMEEKKEDKPVMVDKGANSKKISMEMQETMMDAVEFVDEKVPAMDEMTKLSMKEREGAMPDAFEFATKKGQELNLDKVVMM
eukprot:5333807-Ditylum_brightwellii.AAC.1